MDIERAIDFILDQQARAAEAQRRLEEQQEKLAIQQTQSAQRHDQEMSAIRGEFRRAVRLGVHELRAERKRRQELDDKITQLAAAQLLTEQTLQNFIKSLGRGTNGGSQDQ